MKRQRALEVCLRSVFRRRGKVLNAQITNANSFIASWNNGDKKKWGRGAGPHRAPETTWDQRGPSALTKLEDTHVFGANLMLTGTWSKFDGGFMIITRGGPGPEAPDALLDSDGVWKHNWPSAKFNSPQEQAKIEGAYFFGAGPSSLYYDVATEDLLPGVKMAVSAMTAHALLQQQGYTVNPF